MRVIAGKARRAKLVTPEGLTTRPTTDRIKETLFNMIQFDLPDAVFVDLFAGSGAIGIEALSRGAHTAYFCDTSKEAAECIRKNLKTTHLENQGTLFFKDALSGLATINQMEKHIDILFMDPPYEKELEKQVLESLSKYTCIDENTMIIVEASVQTKFDYLKDLGMKIDKYKTYGKNAHVFISIDPKDSESDNTNDKETE